MSKKIAMVLTKTNEELLTTYMSYAPAGCRLNVSALMNELLQSYLERELPKLEATTYRQ